MASKKGRRARRARRPSRITPRRWLPFVLLIALTAAAVTVERQVSDPEPPQAADIDAPSFLPVAAVPEAMSTAWFCGGGTAVGSDGEAEMSVVIANASEAATTAEISFVGSDGTDGSTEVDIPANDLVRVVAHDHITAPWVAATVEVRGDQIAVEREVSGPNGHDIGGCSSTTSGEWYAPSGSTVRGATAHLILYNPLPGDIGVDITFASDEGSFEPRALQGLTVAGGAVVVVPEEHLPTRRAEMATTVIARSGGLVVDRVQIYDGSGDEMLGEGDLGVTTGPPRGVASKPAIPVAQSRWLIPDVMNEPGSRSQLALLNPGEESAEVDLQFIYEEPARLAEVEPVTVAVPAGEQRVLDLTEVVGLEPSIPFSLALESRADVSVAAELVVFGAVVQQPTIVFEEEPADDPDAVPSDDPEATDEEPGDTGDGVPPEEQEAVLPELVDGFTVTSATPLTATTWYLARRGTSGTRSAWVVVANPGSAPAEITVDSFRDGTREPVPSASVTVPAGDRRTIDLTDAGSNHGLVISSDAPVVVSRSTASDEGVGISATLGSVLPGTAGILPASEQPAA